MAVGLYLADTNILIRLMKRNHPEYQQVRHAVTTLKSSGVELCYTLQNMAEFWNASTRPLARNGFGLTIEETDADAKEIERGFTLLADTSAVYREWRRIVVEQKSRACRFMTHVSLPPCTPITSSTSSHSTSPISAATPASLRFIRAM